MIDLSCIIRIWALVTSVFRIIDAFDRRTDRRWGTSVKFSELIMPRTALIRCHISLVVFQNQLTGVENRGQIFHFFTPYKNQWRGERNILFKILRLQKVGEGLAKYLSQRFKISLGHNLWYRLLLVRSCWAGWNINTFSLPIFLGAIFA